MPVVKSSTPHSRVKATKPDGSRAPNTDLGDRGTTPPPPIPAVDLTPQTVSRTSVAGRGMARRFGAVGRPKATALKRCSASDRRFRNAFIRDDHGARRWILLGSQRREGFRVRSCPDQRVAFVRQSLDLLRCSARAVVPSPAVTIDRSSDIALVTLGHREIGHVAVTSGVLPK